MAKIPQSLTNQAVLKSFEVGITAAAEIFDLDPDDLLDYQRRFILYNYDQLFPVVAPDGPITARPGFLERIRQNPLAELGLRIFLAIVLIVICWAMPSLLQPFVDPLTNTVVWLGFTSLYLTVFIGIAIELVFWVQHRVNFDFLNPLSSTGAFDYATILRSDQLSAFEKCRLNQQKYLAYLLAFCIVITALASLTSGGGN